MVDGRGVDASRVAEHCGDAGVFVQVKGVADGGGGGCPAEGAQHEATLHGVSPTCQEPNKLMVSAVALGRGFLRVTVEWSR